MYFNRISVLFALMTVIFVSCAEQEETPETEVLVWREAFVIGFDQCAKDQGRVLAIVDPPDTVLTYNFPDSIYSFREELFANYQVDCLFPKFVLKNYPVRIKYRPSWQGEFLVYPCVGNIGPRLSALIENKQVAIIAVER
jgi:hypothetical protein